jgi:hypothetical protein
MPLGGPALLWPHHAPSGPALACPTQALMGHWYFRAHFNAVQTKHKQLNFHKQKRKHTQVLIVLQKPQTTK